MISYNTSLGDIMPTKLQGGQVVKHSLHCDCTGVGSAVCLLERSRPRATKDGDRYHSVSQILYRDTTHGCNKFFGRTCGIELMLYLWHVQNNVNSRLYKWISSETNTLYSSGRPRTNFTHFTSRRTWFVRLKISVLVTYFYKPLVYTSVHRADVKLAADSVDLMNKASQCCRIM